MIYQQKNIGFEQFIFECLHPEAFNNLSVHARMHSAMTGDAVPEHNTTDSLAQWSILAIDTEVGKLEVISKQDDKYYERERYVILGALMRNSEWNIARVLSPYFLKIVIDPKTFKTGKQLSKKLHSSVKEFTKWFVDKTERGEVDVDLLNKDDVSVINTTFANCAAQLDAVTNYTGVFEQPGNILRDYTISYETEKDGSSFLFGGFGPDYYAKLLDANDYTKEYYNQTQYKKMSTEEFLARARGEEYVSNDETSNDKMFGHRVLIDNEGKDVDYAVSEVDSELNVRISYKDFLKKYSKADLFEFYCPIVFSVKID